MGSSKAGTPAFQSGVYRDEPDRNDAASTSSAVLLGDIDSYPEEDLPAYSDVPAVPRKVAQNVPLENMTPVSIPFSTSDSFCETIWTNFPDYSKHADTLEQMIRQQSMFPPVYWMYIHGTHTETVKQGNKESKNKIVDFFIRINLTHLLTTTPGLDVENHIEMLEDNRRGYRGGILPKVSPNVSDTEESNALRAWCQKFVEDPASWKAFKLKREVRHHDTARLEQLIRSLIASTNYRGHVSINFPLQHKEVVVLSPGKINELRTKRWLRWVFYLTFLWIFSWPVLFFITKRYEVVKAVFNYTSDPAESEERIPAVMSEMEFFQRWESAIRRGIYGRYDGVMGDDYRIATLEADARGVIASNNPQTPRTGNAFADGALNLLGAGLQIAGEYRDAIGWGADT
ncbi:hypothetical protein BP6252_01302 [Coleophoma cylindrospora]|uniref:Uncharacterized protein n=1 Tax=Coleophoma cylindrospora TaxID=1849047 RepID=A0A3D8SSI9_9HELO|nr:hypothetical protein BP6252_01302 [Coleophoma cylindrospora]